MKRTALTITLALAACSGDDAPAPSEPHSADEGDWFVCANADCTDLQPTGMRLADASVYHLTAAEPPDGHFSEGDPYCVGERFGTYSLDGGVVVFTFHDGGLIVESDFVIDDAGSPRTTATCTRCARTPPATGSTRSASAATD